MFSYNNAALSVAGRVIEVVAGMPYEHAVRELLIDPLGLDHSRFFADEITGFRVAEPHDIVDGKPVVRPAAFALPRGINPAGGLISSARDQIRYARFHLGNGRVPGGTRLLRERSLRAMRSRPGPGGTLFVELDGAGVTWMLRPTAEGVRLAQHGGDVFGQHSGFMMVPERDVAFTLLTNSESGPALVSELFVDDWALRRLAGVRNLRAIPRALPAAALASYTGTYLIAEIGPDGTPAQTEFQLTAEDGQLVAYVAGEVFGRLAFYRRDYALAIDPAGTPSGTRVNFVRDGYGQVTWLRFGGRIIRHVPAGARAGALRGQPQELRLPTPLSLPRAPR